MTAYSGAAVAAGAERDAVARLADICREFDAGLTVAVHDDLAAVESQWRRFEAAADCTAFQTFDWLATWHRHIGQRDGTLPAIAIGSYADGETAFICPLAVEPGRLARRLCWFGQEQCDYNAPLLAPDFARRVTPERFLAAWRELCARLQRDPRLHYDWIELEKMPETIGAQVNPFTYLDVAPNASGAHLTRLGDDWEQFYFVKRSSATRRRDRAKRKHMTQYGDVRFVTAATADDARRTVETLMSQKSRALTRRGIGDIFARPGLREFFLDLASDPKLRRLFHVSRIEIGGAAAATNFAIVFGDCYYHVLASYDEDAPAAHYGPGALHLRELLAYAIGRGLRRFDFTIGDEPYKKEWSDTSVALYDHSAAATWRGWPASFASTMRRRLKRFVKQTPSVWRLVSRLRTAMARLARPKAVEAPAAAAPAARPDRPGKLASAPALACVMGDMDLLAPLAAAGIRCAVMTRPGVPSLYSRHTEARLHWDDAAPDGEAPLAALLDFAKAQSEPPVLFYEEDAQLLFVSRYREHLATALRFVVADATLVEDLVDKARFRALAQRHGLPVPAACHFHPAAAEPEDVELRFPIVVKPLIRLARWNDSFGLRKALEVADVDALRALWPRLFDVGVDLLAQELIPGGETRIESYHCYVDARGRIAADFTGRKIRTFPAAFGHTTALEITDTADVRRQGRDIVERLGLTGVAKFDFKRDPAGKLHLFEINPRFTLWHHPAAVAGLNIPALVYADLLDLPRPTAARAKAGVRWCRAWKDFPAARAAGVPTAKWLAWFWRCEAKSALALNDPMPFLRSTLYRLSTQAGRHEA